MAEILHKIANFIYQNPQGFSHLVDLPYRLSSGSMDDARNFRLWENEGEIEAVGIIQLPWLTLDYAYKSTSEHLVPSIFDWAIEGARQISQETKEDFILAIRFPPERADHIFFAEERGFELDDEWTIVHLSRKLDQTIDVPNLPEGFSFRLLRGEAEVEAYVQLHQTAFNSKAMQVAWRDRSLRMPQYQADLDLFIVNEQDQPVAFCIGWMHPTNPVGQIEPLGVHPDYHQIGLGRAILLEGLRRLQAHGATTAQIDSYKFNDPALSLYQRANNGNFRPHYEATGYKRIFKS